MSVALDLTGRRFDRLTVLGRAANGRTSDGKQRARWNCLCACGAAHVADASSLKAGTIRSCGCLRRERCAAAGRSNAGNQRNGAKVNVRQRAADDVLADVFGPKRPPPRSDADDPPPTRPDDAARDLAAALRFPVSAD